MSEIMRYEVNEEWAYSGIVEAGDFIFLSFCEGNVGQSIEAQVNGTLDDMCQPLEIVDLSLESIVKVDVMMKDPWNIPIMKKVFKQHFNGKYPARKTISTEFANKSAVDSLQIQIDEIAYRG